MIYFGDDETDGFRDWSEIDPPVTPRRLDSFVKRLHRIAPHIRWCIKAKEHDLGVYHVIAVPDQHYPEAEFILDKIANGQNLRGYSREWLYPTLYVKKGRKWVVNPAIIRFRDSAMAFCTLLDLTRHYNQDAIRHLIAALSALCIDVHALPNEAPPEGESDRFNPAVVPQLDSAETYRHVSPYSRFDEPETHSLCEDLVAIYREIAAGLWLLNTNDPGKMLEAVGHWRFEYKWTWGEIAARALSALADHLVPT